MKQLLRSLKIAFILFLVCGITGIAGYYKIKDIDSKLQQQLNSDKKEKLQLADSYWNDSYDKNGKAKAAEIYFSLSGEDIDSDEMILGRISESFENGYAVQKNKDTSLKLRKKAAEIGNGYLSFVLGKSYFDKGNYTAAEKWLKKAFETQNEKYKQYKGKSSFYLGKIYSGAGGVKKDKKLAESYFVAAADNGEGDKESYTVAAKYYNDKDNVLSTQYALEGFSIDTPEEAVNFILTALETSSYETMADTIWDIWKDLNGIAGEVLVDSGYILQRQHYACVGSLTDRLTNHRWKYSYKYGVYYHPEHIKDIEIKIRYLKAPVSSISFSRPYLTAKKDGDNWVVFMKMSIERVYREKKDRDLPTHEDEVGALYIDVKNKIIYSGNQKGYDWNITLWNCIDHIAGMDSRRIVFTEGPVGKVCGKEVAMSSKCYMRITNDMIHRYMAEEMPARTMARVKKLNGEMSRK